MAALPCQGLPDRPCPWLRSGASVHYTIYDLFLCHKCESTREEENKLQLQAPDVTTDGSSNGVASGRHKLIPAVSSEGLKIHEVVDTVKTRKQSERVAIAATAKLTADKTVSKPRRKQQTKLCDNRPPSDGATAAEASETHERVADVAESQLHGVDVDDRGEVQQHPNIDDYVSNERFHALKLKVEEQDVIIKQLSNRLSFVLSMLGADDNLVSIDTGSPPDINNRSEFPDLPVVSNFAISKPIVDILDNKKHAINSKNDKPINVKIDAQRTFSHAVLSAVYKENQSKNKRSKCFVVSGLDVSSNNSDSAAVKNLCNSQLNIDVGIIQCKRLGKDPAIAGAGADPSSSSSSNRTRPILVTVSTANHADEVIASAKKLRKSSDPTISNGVYINKFLSRLEAQLAYEDRCKRRSKPNRTSTTPADNNNKTGTTIVVTNSPPIQQMSSLLNPEASYFCPTQGVQQASNIGLNN
jgi:hypothetical protein